MAQYDLTKKIVPHLDRHMVWPLLEFLQERKVYASDDITKAKIQLASKTRMIDAAITEFEKLNPKKSVPEDLKNKKQTAHKDYSDLKNTVAPLLKALSDDKVLSLKSKPTHENLLDAIKNLFPEVKDDQVENLYHYAKINFDCGLYEKCANYLADYRLLSKDEDKKFWALWGKLAAEILIVHFEAAFKDVLALRDAIDSRSGVDQATQLQQRTWLLHSSLFLLFNLKNEDEKVAIVDLYFSDKYLNAIQLNAPHLLRYLTAAVITRTHDLKDVLRVLKQERDHKDPLTDFLVLLHVEYDFKAIKANLRQCEKVLQNDLFLSPIISEFVDSARLLVFETYCRIHQTIDIPTLADILDIKEDVEQHLVELIRQARVSAKIDSSKNQLLITPKQTSVYQQVIGATKVLSYRSNQLMMNIEKQYAKQG
jgi:translation initiation factor 3 subunit E